MPCWNEQNEFMTESKEQQQKTHIAYNIPTNKMNRIQMYAAFWNVKRKKKEREADAIRFFVLCEWIN